MANVSVDKSRYKPTREAVFTETMQIGIVVRDLRCSAAEIRRRLRDQSTSSTPRTRRTCTSTASRSNAPAATPSPRRAFDDAVAAQAKRGNNLVLSGTFSGANVAYLRTDRDLGVIIEIFSGTPGTEQEPDAT